MKQVNEHRTIAASSRALRPNCAKQPQCLLEPGAKASNAPPEGNFVECWWTLALNCGSSNRASPLIW